MRILSYDINFFSLHNVIILCGVFVSGYLIYMLYLQQKQQMQDDIRQLEIAVKGINS